ncbi:hypothetical protein P7C73_g3569, partial [Tremellales sp. Uapishka_1]
MTSRSESQRIPGSFLQQDVSDILSSEQWEDMASHEVDDLDDTVHEVDNLDDMASEEMSATTPRSISRHSGRTSPSPSVTSSGARRSYASPRKVGAPRRRPAAARPSRAASPPAVAHKSSRTKLEFTPKPASPSPSLNSTLSLVLSPVRLLGQILPVQLFLSPILAHLVNLAILFSLGLSLAYFLLPRIPGFLFSLASGLVRFLTSNWISSLSSLRADGLAELPLRALATPSCALFNILCSLSLVASGNHTAVPIWKWKSMQPDKKAVNVAQVARGLTTEARGAKDIFESITHLGEGRLIGGLHHVRLWELSAAVKTGSNLEDKDMVAEQLDELGDLTRDLSDEIIRINSLTVSAFSWLQWEFGRIVQLLALSPHLQPSPGILERQLHSLMVRLQDTVDEIYKYTSNTLPHASFAADHGHRLLTHLHGIKASLQREHEREPGWKIATDQIAHLLVGGEPSKRQLIDRDLSLTKETIDDLGTLRRSLESTRIEIKTYRDQLGDFNAKVMGFHLGASEEGGLGAAEEVRILAGVVQELGSSVGRAKDWKKEGDRGNLRIDA